MALALLNLSTYYHQIMAADSRGVAARHTSRLTVSVWRVRGSAGRHHALLDQYLYKITPGKYDLFYKVGPDHPTLVQGHRCEAYLKPQYYSHWYLRVMQFLFLLGITAAAVSFAVSVTWCSSDLWTTIALSTISATMWSIKAPLYIPVWSPSYWCALPPPCAVPLCCAAAVRRLAALCRAALSAVCYPIRLRCALL